MNETTTTVARDDARTPTHRSLAELAILEERAFRLARDFERVARHTMPVHDEEGPGEQPEDVQRWYEAGKAIEAARELLTELREDAAASAVTPTDVDDAERDRIAAHHKRANGRRPWRMIDGWPREKVADVLGDPPYMILPTAELERSLVELRLLRHALSPVLCQVRGVVVKLGGPEPSGQRAAGEWLSAWNAPHFHANETADAIVGIEHPVCAELEARGAMHEDARAFGASRFVADTRC